MRPGSLLALLVPLPLAPWRQPARGGRLPRGPQGRCHAAACQTRPAAAAPAALQALHAAPEQQGWAPQVLPAAAGWARGCRPPTARRCPRPRRRRCRSSRPSCAAAWPWGLQGLGGSREGEELGGVGHRSAGRPVTLRIAMRVRRWLAQAAAGQTGAGRPRLTRSQRSQARSCYVVRCKVIEQRGDCGAQVAGCRAGWGKARRRRRKHACARRNLLRGESCPGSAKLLAEHAKQGYGAADNKRQALAANFACRPVVRPPAPLRASGGPIVPGATRPSGQEQD